MLRYFISILLFWVSFGYVGILGLIFLHRISFRDLSDFVTSQIVGLVLGPIITIVFVIHFIDVTFNGATYIVVYENGKQNIKRVNDDEDDKNSDMSCFSE